MNAPAYLSDLDRYLDDAGIEHFSAAEICDVGRVVRHRHSGAHVRLQAAPRSSWSNILPTLQVIEWLRARVGPLIVNGAYRDRAYNAAVGGEERSLHLVFNAVDFRSSTRSPLALAREILKHPDAEQLGLGVYLSFVHVDARGAIGRPAPQRWGTPSLWWRS